MHNCAKDVLNYHNEEVTLPMAERTGMREKRDANRKRLTRGLTEAKRPLPYGFASQGSYAMKTMVQHPKNHYDIDDGVYFEKSVLATSTGTALAPAVVRQMVRDALDNGSFTTPPKVRKNCVRVHYAAGYHVDMPIYRHSVSAGLLGQVDLYELASGDAWVRSDARDTTAWFDEKNKKLSPDSENGGQFRRVVREIKKHSRSREIWENQTLSGIGITALAAECFVADSSREDKALYGTMKAIRNRLLLNLVVKHPVTPGETITNGSDDPKAKFLRDKLTEAIDTLAPLFEANCTREKALKCWDKAFVTSFFTENGEKNAPKSASLLRPATVVPATSTFSFPDAPRTDYKPRGFA